MIGVRAKIFLGSIAVSVACASWSGSVSKTTLAEALHSRVVLMEPELKRFRARGPFSVSERRGVELPIDLTNTVVMDHFYAQSTDKVPIVFITHGNYSGRAAHHAQARYLASWGFHVIVSDFPNRNQWIQNGDRLKSLTDLIYRQPNILGPNADASRIVLVGHSFGGSASIMAASKGAPVIGLVLLDPAVVHKRVLKDMQSIDLPVILLGADKEIFTSRGRNSFWRHVGGDLLEISVPNATHDDAQGPSMFARSTLGVDPFTSRDNQKIFRSMLTVSVLGLSTSGTVDFPLGIFEKEEKNGTLQELRFRSGVALSEKTRD